MESINPWLFEKIKTLADGDGRSNDIKKIFKQYLPINKYNFRAVVGKKELIYKGLQDLVPFGTNEKEELYGES